MGENTTLNNVVEEAIEETAINETGSGTPTGLVVLIGGLVVAGVVAGAIKLKKMYDERKATEGQIVDAKIVDEFDEEEVDSEDEE